MGVPILGISGLPFGSPLGQKDNWVLVLWPCTKYTIYYKGEGGGFPQVRAVVSFVSLCLPVTRLCTKGALITH
jgi:hypothetical protein